MAKTDRHLPLPPNQSAPQTPLLVTDIFNNHRAISREDAEEYNPEAQASRRVAAGIHSLALPAWYEAKTSLSIQYSGFDGRTVSNSAVSYKQSNNFSAAVRIL